MWPSGTAVHERDREEEALPPRTDRRTLESVRLPVAGEGAQFDGAGVLTQRSSFALRVGGSQLPC
jgi:hypothetical protein